MFHALTGCDNVSSFARRGMKTAWEDTARTLLGAAAAVLCTACYAHHREVRDPVI